MPIDEYKGAISPNDTDWTDICWAHRDMSDDWKAGFNLAMNTLWLWFEFRQHIQDSPVISADMWKSRLLRRLIIGEQIRRVPCPEHQGNMLMFDDCDQCQGTGWLPNKDDDLAKNRGRGYHDLGPFKVYAVPRVGNDDQGSS